MVGSRFDYVVRAFDFVSNPGCIGDTQNERPSPVVRLVGRCIDGTLERMGAPRRERLLETVVRPLVLRLYGASSAEQERDAALGGNPALEAFDEAVDRYIRPYLTR